MKNLKFLLAVPLLAFISCSEDEIYLNLQLRKIKPQSSITDNLTEIAFPNKTGIVSDVYFAGRKLPVE